MTGIACEKSKLSLQYNESINGQLIDVCMPLFKYFSITHFFYIRVFNNNSMLYLCTDKKWVQHYIAQNFQNDTMHMCSYTPISNINFSLWSAFKKDKVYSAVYDFNIWNGFNIYERKEDSIIIYAFGSTNYDTHINNFYINNINLLQDFISYFKKKAINIIETPFMYNLIISKRKSSYQKTFIREENIQKSYQEINLKQIAFKDRLSMTYLTKNESLCLYYLVSGKTAKETAALLNLSPRTIEFYLNNIKTKTGYRTRADLIRGCMEHLGSYRIILQ